MPSKRKASGSETTYNVHPQSLTHFPSDKLGINQESHMFGYHITFFFTE